MPEAPVLSPWCGARKPADDGLQEGELRSVVLAVAREGDVPQGPAAGYAVRAATLRFERMISGASNVPQEE